MAVPCIFEGNKQVQLRRGTTAENDAFTGAEGEVTYDTEQHRLRTHDGVTVGGFAHALLSANIFTGNQSINGNTLLNIDGSASFGGNTLQITNTGLLLLADGTTGSPSLSFVSDPDVGLYHYGVNQMGISIAGSPKAVWTTDGLWLGNSDIRFSFGFGSDPDVILFGDGGHLGLRMGPGGFASPQIHLYNNYVDGLNWERLNLEWNANNAFLSTERLGTGLFRSLALGSEGAATVSLRTNATNWYTLSTTGVFVGTKSAIGTTPTDNLQLANATAAANGAQQNSPALRFSGAGWKSDAVAASQALDWRVYAESVQGAAAPTSNLKFDFSVNGGAFGNRLSLSSAGVLSFFDGARQTFNPDATNSGFNVGSVAGNPSVLVNGDIWYNSTTNELMGQVNGFTVVLAPAFPVPPFSDSNPIIEGSADVTKLLRFEIDGFTAFTTRVLTPQNADYILAGTNIVNTFTSNQSINGNILLNTDGSASFSTGALTISTAGLITFPDGVRQTFNPDATNSGLNVGSIAGDPSTPSNGDIWYNSTTNILAARIDGVTQGLGTKGWMQYHQIVGTSRFERYYLAGHASATAMATLAVATGTFYAIPFIAGRGGTVDRLAFAVTTGSGAGGVGRAGIYATVSDIDPYPGALVVDGGEFTVTGTGMKTATISQALVPNKLYFFVVLFGTAAPTVRAINPAGGAFAFFGADNAFGTVLGFLLTVAQAYGALPGTFPSGGAINTTTVLFPAIGVRFSA